MNKANVYILAIIILAAFFIGGAVYDLLNQKKTPFSEFKEIAAHFYKNPSKNISVIRLKVFYAVPQNRVDKIAADWQIKIREVLEKAVQFHNLQFRGKSDLKYEIYPQPVILSRDNTFYDTDNTNKGNPRALIAVAEEIERRVLRPNGDLYNDHFAEKKAGEYPVMGLIYEGVGASGGVILESPFTSLSEAARDLQIPESIIFKVDVESADGFFLISSEYFTKPAYQIAAASLFYHEFAHSFGLPDLYDSDTGVAYSEDIMGSGRYDSIQTAYLDSLLLKDLGVSQ